MKIRDRLTGGVSGTAPVRSKEKASEPADVSRMSSGADRVQISSRSLEVQKARLAALQAPDIRQGMVDEVVGLISRGEYQVTGAQVAPKMIREHLMDAGG